MITTFIAFAIGMLFIFLEFYVPGAILGTIGAIILFVSIILFANATESAGATLLYVVVMVGLLALLIRYTLWRIPRVKSKYSIYLHGDQEGYQASHYDVTAIGKKGIVISDLKPGGYINIEGKKYQAISQSGYIAKGAEVIVIGGAEESLNVKLSKKEQT